MNLPATEFPRIARCSEFSAGGVVIDVLHMDYRYKIGHSALQYQYLQHLETGLPMLGPGPGE